MYRTVTLPLASLLFILAFSTTATAQTTRLQFIHNAPDDTLQVIDVYLNEVLLEDDFYFLTATAFLDLPAGDSVAIAVAPATSSGVADAYASFQIATPDDATLIAVLSGVLDPSTFPPNPDGQDIGLSLIVNERPPELSTTPDSVNVFFLQGNPGIAALRIEVNHSAEVLTDSLLYGEQTPYYHLNQADNFNLLRAVDGRFRGCYFLPFSDVDVFPLLVVGLSEYYLSVVAVRTDGSIEDLRLIAESNEDEIAQPQTLTLGSIFPHPVQGSCTITFDLAETAEVQITLYDMLGRRVFSSHPRFFSAGDERTLTMNAADLSPGVYVYRIRAQTQLGVLERSGKLLRIR